MTRDKLLREILRCCVDMDVLQGVRVVDDEVRVWILGEDEDAERAEIWSRLTADPEIDDALQAYTLTFILPAQHD